MLGYVVKKEGASRRVIGKNIRDGSLVLVKNAGRDIKPLAIGAGVSTKINANIGISPEKKSLRQELAKARVAVEYGADTLMDLSIDGDVDKVRKRILRETTVPLGTVPIYQVFGEKRLNFTLEDYLRVLEKQCREGVDFTTIHAGVTRDAVKHAGKRIIPITSRGGCFLAAWMSKHDAENPLYTGFNEILEILEEHEVTISLGDGLRPGCIHDATDRAQLTELKTLGRLTKTAWKAGVRPD
jgi:phosphomethylpyrimidine synthase